MKVELRKVKIAKNLSEETIAFTADLWVDGEQIGYVRNDGRGGANLVSPIMVKDQSTIGRIREFESWCETQPPRHNRHDVFDMTADYYISLMVEDYQEEQQVKRWCKTKTVIRLEGDKVGEYHTYNFPYSADFAQRVRSAEPKLVEIVNERFIKEAR